ncbi:MAG: cupin domain-containing protein [Epsilonproteobacteria bacterium]|nr:cupin domain-containing protein [Campylobacterota bacterium]
MLVNLFDELPVPETGETFKKLLGSQTCRIELIVSSDTPEPVLYDQEEDEAVLLIEGGATLWMDGRSVSLSPGDFLLIPAHTPHRVVQTLPGTRWLAIFSGERLC